MLPTRTRSPRRATNQDTINTTPSTHTHEELGHDTLFSIPKWRGSLSSKHGDEQELPLMFDHFHNAGKAEKRRPLPIYKDKRVEEYWAFLETVPQIETNRLPAPSRCPSLLSTSTISSRNSSTRSIRSSIWDLSDDRHWSKIEMNCPSNCSGVCCQINSVPSRLTQTSLKCPVIASHFHTTSAALPSDRTESIFDHFTDVLRCNFCTEDPRVPAPTFECIDSILAHMVQHHGATNQQTADDTQSTEFSKDVSFSTNGKEVATCSVCTEPFSVQSYHDHLPGCILRAIGRKNPASVAKEERMPTQGFGALPELSLSGSECDQPLRGHQTEKTEEAVLVDLTEYASKEDDGVEDLTTSSRCLSLTSSKCPMSSDEETDCTEEQTSRESSPGVSQIPRRLSPAKRRLVENVMQEFRQNFYASLRTHTTAASSSGSSSSGSGTWSSNASTYSTNSTSSRKRSLSGGGSPPPNDDDDSNKRRRPGAKQESKHTATELRFACPYYKRNPGRHQTFTSCRDPGFATVARLKEHLYRRHLLPPQCHRCCTTFANNMSLREHQRDLQICTLREQIPLEGFDKDQERRLKSKKRSQTYQAEEEKWRGVYRILFPDDGDADMPSPYIEYQPCIGQIAEPSNVIRFQEFSRLELPRLVRRTLEAVIEEEAQPLEEKLKERLVHIVKECQTQLVSMFQTTTGAIDEAITPAMSNTMNTQMSMQSPPVEMDSVPSSIQGCDTIAACATEFTHASHSTGVKFTPTIPPCAQSQIAPSSKSSDSGYDSTWQVPNTTETRGHIQRISPGGLDGLNSFESAAGVDMLDIWDPVTFQLTQQQFVPATNTVDEATFWPYTEPFYSTCTMEPSGMDVSNEIGTNWQMQ